MKSFRIRIIGRAMLLRRRAIRAERQLRPTNLNDSFVFSLSAMKWGKGLG
jgi:hypothetical protein